MYTRPILLQVIVISRCALPRNSNRLIDALKQPTVSFTSHSTFRCTASQMQTAQVPMLHL